MACIVGATFREGGIPQSVPPFLGASLGEMKVYRFRQAAQQAQIADFIEARATSYNALLGERGIRLSGGQRQRIGIARAL